MLKDPEMFAIAEDELRKNGIIERFEAENGPIKGRMMITLADAPEELGIEGLDTEGVFTFNGSFDFYDSMLGLALNVITLEPVAPIWVTPQIEGAEPPNQTWTEFFIETLAKSIEKDGVFGVPMYSFVTDNADFTAVPSKPED